MDKFVNLHVHSTFSLLDGLIRVNELFDKVNTIQQPAGVITDHGNMAAIVHAAQYAEKVGQKYIPGVECYWVKDATVKTKEKDSENDISRNHFLLLAKNNDGYKRLLKISSWGSTKGFYFRPRIDDSVIEKYGTEGVIATSACFLPGVDVLTKTGIKDITEIFPGEKVLTHQARWKSATPTSRLYKGNFYKFKINGLSCTVTENHKFLVLKNKQPIWKEAKDINENDICLTAINETTKEDINQFTLGNSETPFNLPVTPELIELFGIYFACGRMFESVKVNMFYSENISHIKDIVQKVFNISPNYYSYNTLFYSDETFYTFFFAISKLYRKEVFIPSFIKNINPNMQINFLKGYLINKNFSFDTINITTKSKRMMYDIAFLLNRNFISPKLNDDYSLDVNKEELVYLLEGNSLINNVIEYNNVKYLACNIQEIQTFYDERKVYCLNVEEDHSFTVNNFITHNCIAGRIQQQLLKDNYKEAKEIAEHYAMLFKDGFYLELQPCYDDGGRQIKANLGLIEISKETGIPLILSTDAHYLNQEDYKAHEVLLCIQSKNTLSNPNRWKFPGQSYFIMTREEILSYFSKNGHEILDQKAIEEAADNTVTIAEQCNVTFSFGKHYLPCIDPYKNLEDPIEKKKFEIFENRRIMEVSKRENCTFEDAKARLDPPAEYLRFLCIHGWNGILKKLHIDKKHLSLMFYELDVIISMGFPSYFLIVYDIMEFCEKEHIARGVARGCGKGENHVLLSSGELKELQKLHVGDEIIAGDGKPHTILNTYEYDCNENLIVLTTKDNRKLNGFTKDHKIFAKKKNTIKPDWYESNSLDIGDYLVDVIYE